MLGMKQEQKDTPMKKPSFNNSIPYVIKCSKCGEDHTERWCRSEEEIKYLRDRDFSKFLCSKCTNIKESFESMKLEDAKRDAKKDNVEIAHQIGYLKFSPKLYKCSTCGKRSYDKELFDFFVDQWGFDEEDYERIICKLCLQNGGFIEEDKPDIYALLKDISDDVSSIKSNQ